MNFNIYDLEKIAYPDIKDSYQDIQVAITNGNKVILLNNDACHTVHNLDDVVMGPNSITARQVINSPSVATTNDIGSWVRTFGKRIEINYGLLLKSIKKIGLDPKDFPRRASKF